MGTLNAPKLYVNNIFVHQWDHNTYFFLFFFFFSLPIRTFYGTNICIVQICSHAKSVYDTVTLFNAPKNVFDGTISLAITGGDMEISYRKLLEKYTIKFRFFHYFDFKTSCRVYVCLENSINKEVTSQVAQRRLLTPGVNTVFFEIFKFNK